MAAQAVSDALGEKFLLLSSWSS
jgi:hypothetical protein